MKLICRLVFLIALIVAVVCVVLLLNFTAPNPTGRRYSSQPVQINGNTQDIGLSGERVLSQDLHTPDNNDPDQRQCICNNPRSNTPPISQCRVCMAYSQSVANYRIPDFVAANFIAESKNRQSLLYKDSDTLEQLGDYVIAARALGRPLWLYVRVDTQVDPEYYRLIETTGGGVVAYFATPGYVDPLDQIAGKVLPAAGIVVILMGVWEIGARRIKLSPRPPKDPLSRTHTKTDSAEGFVKQAKDRAQRKIDQEDARSDDRH